MDPRLLVPQRDVKFSGNEFSIDFAAGTLRLRLAETDGELAAAQSLRYRVFGRRAVAPCKLSRRDFDEYDDVTDHFIVTDPEALAAELSYLYHYCRAPEEVRTRALGNRYVELNRLSAEAIDLRVGFPLMPPLLKGYLRLGGVIGDGAVVDHQFGTTDVCVVVRRGGRIERYVNCYNAREAALRAG